MTTPAEGAVLGQSSPAGADGGRRGPFNAGPGWMMALPPLAMLAMALWGITGPSYWRDEAATLTAVHRPLPRLLAMMGHVDAVHGVYYLLTWVVVQAGGTGELAVRLPSALAMTGAAAAVAALGRRLASPGAGLGAGLVFAVLPQVSLYAQDAREYAMVTALAAAGSYLLVRAITTVGRRRGWLAGYAACLAVMGALNVLSLTLIAAHAVTLALIWRRGRHRARDRSAVLTRRGGPAQPAAGRSLVLGWLAAVAAGAAAAGPVVVLGFGQRHTLGWLHRPGLADIAQLRMLIGPAPMAAAALAVIALGIGVPALEGRTALTASWPPLLLALCLPWLLLPPVLLVGASFATPVYVFRYLLFCAPAAALLVGTGLAALPWAASLAAFAVIALLGVPTQGALRAPGGHGTNIRAVDSIVAAAMRPGDGALYVGHDAKYVPAAYPYGLARVRDVGRRRTPSQAGNLTGSRLTGPALRRRLRGVPRLWVVKIGSRPHPAITRTLHFRLVRAWHRTGIWLLLYARAAAG